MAPIDEHVTHDLEKSASYLLNQLSDVICFGLTVVRVEHPLIKSLAVSWSYKN